MDTPKAGDSHVRNQKTCSATWCAAAGFVPCAIAHEVTAMKAVMVNAVRDSSVQATPNIGRTCAARCPVRFS
jgi:hypothetical protein